jgi:hypothetical protein
MEIVEGQWYRKMERLNCGGMWPTGEKVLVTRVSPRMVHAEHTSGDTQKFTKKMFVEQYGECLSEDRVDELLLWGAVSSVLRAWEFCDVQRLTKDECRMILSARKAVCEAEKKYTDVIAYLGAVVAERGL